MQQINVETFMWLDLLFPVTFVLESRQIHLDHFFADPHGTKLLCKVESRKMNHHWLFLQE